MSIDIDAIEARANAATPGPWEWHGHPFQNVTGNGLETFYSVWVSGKPTLAAKGDAIETIIGKRETMIFIAAARSDVPALCAEVRELRAALERARALLKRIEWQDATTRPIYCDIVVCVACGRDHPNHKPGCDLAALMAAAPGGAA